jgi:hypothetical protein
MKSKERLKLEITVSAAIYTIFGTVPSQRLADLSEAMKSLEHCNMHGGLNAQVTANMEFSTQVATIIRELSDHQLEAAVKNIDVADEQICCDAYPACKEG